MKFLVLIAFLLTLTTCQELKFLRPFDGQIHRVRL